MLLATTEQLQLRQRATSIRGVAATCIVSIHLGSCIENFGHKSDTKMQKSRAKKKPPRGLFRKGLIYLEILGGL